MNCPAQRTPDASPFFRRTYPRAGALLVAAFVQTSLAADPSPSNTNGPTRTPNIVYIMADDLGYGDLSCYGQKKFNTPNLDRLAAEGMRFTDHYSGSTVCAPTRCVLMTGYHTGHAAIRGNREHRPIGQQPMPADTVTIAQLLKDAGYATGAFGKWGLGYPGSESDPNKMGFDVFYGYNCQRNAHNYYPSFLFHNDEKVPLDGKTYTPPLITEQALKFIRENKDRPFFCYVPVTIPHAAMHCPAELHDKFRQKFPQFEDKIGKYAGPKVKNPIAAFAGMVTLMDEHVGRIVELLKELKIEDNTVVMFTSDNGPHLEGGHDPRFFDSNGPLTGFKRDLTEGGIRAPLIAWWPGKIKAGTTSDHVSAHWDVLPTLCELAEIEPPTGIDGISYAPTLFGQSDRQAQHDYLYWEFYPRAGKRAVRMGKWKALQHRVGKQDQSPLRLFDLSKDIAEQHDVAQQYPEIVAKMRKVMREAHTPSPHWSF